MRQLEIEEIESVGGGNLSIANRAYQLAQLAIGIINAASPGSLDVAEGWEWQNLTA